MVIGVSVSAGCCCPFPLPGCARRIDRPPAGGRGYSWDVYRRL